MTTTLLMVPAGSDICFAVVASFAMLILIQSPTTDAAIKANELLQTWRIVVRDQSRISPLFLLTLARLNRCFSAGIPHVFLLPPQVEG